MSKDKQLAKKRMMFIQKEDYNFLTYNFLLLLNELDCNSETNRFHDFRRIAYLIEFISNMTDIEDYQTIELSNIYLRAQLKKKLLSHLIITLKNKGYLDASLNTVHRTLDIWIYKEKIPNDFFDIEYFKKEIKNIKKIKKFASIQKQQKLKTMVDKLFTDRGVLTWEI
ncbi:MAG: hypothetical protein V2A75_04150 [Pseudomonadota bacterium]